jgi:hypothetical protein
LNKVDDFYWPSGSSVACSASDTGPRRRGVLAHTVDELVPAGPAQYGLVGPARKRKPPQEPTAGPCPAAGLLPPVQAIVAEVLPNVKSVPEPSEGGACASATSLPRAVITDINCRGPSRTNVGPGPTRAGKREKKPKSRWSDGDALFSRSGGDALFSRSGGDALFSRSGGDALSSRSGGVRGGTSRARPCRRKRQVGMNTSPGSRDRAGPPCRSGKAILGALRRCLVSAQQKQ